MDTMQVNWEALDALVIDFAKSERLFADSSPPSSPLTSSASSSYRWRRLICQIRRSLEFGDIDAAIDLLRVNAPVLLDDRRLLFCLQKQKFIELLRKGTDEDRDSAIRCARKSLAPCALDAYPEAYEEFKHVLLAFIYDKDDEMSPVANEWSAKRRYEIAGLISSVLRAELHAYDPIFSMALRYLISIHKGFCLRQGVSSPISNLTERLLLEERDPPPRIQENLYEAPPFDEVDIQALAHAVELTRQGAVESLKFAKGDLHKAFQNELCRIKLDISELDELVHEYCVYRGIVEYVPVNHVDQLNHGSNTSPNSSFGSENDVSVTSDPVEDSQTKTEPVCNQRSSVEARYLCDAPALNEDCSTSRTCKSKDNKVVVHRNHQTPSGERGKRKRWRGRNDDSEYCRNLKSPPWCTNLSHEVDKHHEIILGVKEFTTKGMAAEVVDEINYLDPEFFDLNPTLLFQLKQAEFYKHIHGGDQASAMKIASSYLGPLAAKDSTLLKPLKETLLALLRPPDEQPQTADDFRFDALAASLQVAVGRRLGIEEPQLMKIVRAALYTHTEWFKLQMCRDGFESLLWINSLKCVGSRFRRPPPSGDGSCSSKSLNDASGQASSSLITLSSCTNNNTRMGADGCSVSRISTVDIGCDENAVLKVMEFLALPRADAIHLLAQYNGNAETVIQQLF
ncbi:hypothetical protein M569_05856, partial [Genlisea aurea]